MTEISLETPNHSNSLCNNKNKSASNSNFNQNELSGSGYKMSSLERE